MIVVIHAPLASKISKQINDICFCFIFYPSHSLSFLSVWVARNMKSKNEMRLSGELFIGDF